MITMLPPFSFPHCWRLDGSQGMLFVAVGVAWALCLKVLLLMNWSSLNRMTNISGFPLSLLLLCY